MTEADIVRMGEVGARRNLFGRRMIKLPYKRIDRSNVLEAVGRAMAIHAANASEIRYLWNYYRGMHPILWRTKQIRPEINNKLVVNVANEIVSFNVGFRVGEPVQLIALNNDPGVAEGIVQLNKYMFAIDKAGQDQELVEWQNVGGTSYRMALPAEDDGEESPFELFTLDPQETFVAYSTVLGNPPLFGAVFYRIENRYVMEVYTDTEVFVIEGRKNEIIAGKGVLVREEGHALGMVPIFEYPANRARIGAFEICIGLCDALDLLASNRLDGVACNHRHCSKCHDKKSDLSHKSDLLLVLIC